VGLATVCAVSELEVTTHVDAPANAVWALIADPTRMGEWSPECQRVNWKRGTTKPAVGALFRGRNRNGWRRWSTDGTVLTYEPGRGLSWEVSFGPLKIARWAYRIEPDPDGHGCTVVESFLDLRTPVMKSLGPLARGVSDVEPHNRAGMETTLARIKAVAERQAAPS
jgi:uncharacterized protein YndB with AHSA1/START domain